MKRKLVFNDIMTNGKTRIYFRMFCKVATCATRSYNISQAHCPRHIWYKMSKTKLWVRPKDRRMQRYVINWISRDWNWLAGHGDWWMQNFVDPFATQPLFACHNQ